MLKVGSIYKGVKVSIVHGDITQQVVGAIVNAANGRLAHGAGVAGAILKHGGFLIQEESDRYIQAHGRVPTGEVGLTSGGKLNCKYIIHAVGPVYGNHNGQDEVLLKNAVLNSLLKADELKIDSIAIPAISSGIFGFPKELCAEIMMQTSKVFIDNKPHAIKDIRFVNFDSLTCEIFIDKFNHFYQKEEVSKAAGQEFKITENLYSEKFRKEPGKTIEKLVINAKIKEFANVNEESKGKPSNNLNKVPEKGNSGKQFLGKIVPKTTDDVIRDGNPSSGQKKMNVRTQIGNPSNIKQSTRNSGIGSNNAYPRSFSTKPINKPSVIGKGLSKPFAKK